MAHSREFNPYLEFPVQAHFHTRPHQPVLWAFQRNLSSAIIGQNQNSNEKIESNFLQTARNLFNQPPQLF